MVSVINNSKEFKELNERSWQINANFIIEHGLPHVNIERLLSEEIGDLKKKNRYLNTLLDIGCGTGWLKNIIPNSLDYKGVDNCSRFISKLSKNDKCYSLFDVENEHPNSDIENLKSDILVCSLSLIETPFLEKAFKNLFHLASNGAYLIIVGLNPFTELIKASKSHEELRKYLELYQSKELRLLISKTIKSNGSTSDSAYHRILYSPNDYIQQAKENGFHLVDFKDGNNKNDIISQTVYQYFLFKKS